MAVLVGRLLPREPQSRSAQAAAKRATRRVAGASPPGAGFGLLVAIGMLDNAARPAFLLYLPFCCRRRVRR